MTFIISMLSLASVTMVIPLIIIKLIAEKKQQVKRLIILPFFLLGWILQSFLAIVFWGTMSSTLVWICDVSVFVMPIIAAGIAHPVCGIDKPF